MKSHTPPANSTPSSIRTVAFVSLGCPKNLIDSEQMLGHLAADGMIPTANDEEADAIVINTCGFLESAKDESLEQIDRAADLKRKGSCKRLVVAGCLVQRHRAKLLDWCDQIDALVGVFDRDRIVEAVRNDHRGADDLEQELPVYSSIASNATIAARRRGIEPRGYHESDTARLRLTPRHYAYLRISEGCNQNCAFCTIPSIRGKMRSKPPDKIIAELLELVRDGAFEVNLIGQDTTSYGADIGYDRGLVGLLESLDEAADPGSGHTPENPGGWLRLMYAYPSCFTDPMIDAIGRLPRVVKYIDMPLQHINDTVLERMRRHTSRKQIETLLAKLRDRVPDIAIRTTFISGFPGETKDQHAELVEFVRSFRFEAMGVFPYSPEPGTPAGAMHRDGRAITAEVVQERIDDLMTTQQQVVFDRNEERARRAEEVWVLIDGPWDNGGSDDGKSRPHAYAGRTYRQAPEIDSVHIVLSDQELVPGELVRCRLAGSDGYDLIARPIDELDPTFRLPVVSD